ncbi:hypothetical protein E2320_002757 [Naja naja]|nr:hypothetical protein E2320_002757 [Naja naja]
MPEDVSPMVVQEGLVTFDYNTTPLKPGDQGNKVHLFCVASCCRFASSDSCFIQCGRAGFAYKFESSSIQGASVIYFLHDNCIVRVTPAKLDAARPEEAEKGRSLSNDSHPPFLLNKEPVTSDSTSSQFQNWCDASTLTEEVNYHLFNISTDLCNNSNLPEVEIISLLEEQLPLYKLRADTIFGYDHQDWIQTPQVSSAAAAALTFKQIEETLEYFCK